MFFNNTLCSKCLGCNKLSLEPKYFPGTYKCSDFVLAKVDEKKQEERINTKKVCDAITTIHAILGIEQVQVTAGEQLSINNMQN